MCDARKQSFGGLTVKTKIIIIEDSMYRSFTTKQILESQLKLAVEVVNLGCGTALKKLALNMNAETVVMRQTGSVAELLNKLKKRNTNCRNTEVTLLLAEDFEDELVNRFQDYLTSLPKTAHAA